MNGGIDAQYFTSGAVESTDVRIASEVARQFGLNHRHLLRQPRDLDTLWEETCRRLVLQNDGFVSLWQVQDLIGAPSRVTQLWAVLFGFGSPMARGFFGQPMFYLGKQSPNRTLAQIEVMNISTHHGLLREEALAVTRDYIKNYVYRAASENWAAVDILDLYSVHHQIFRWAAANTRKSEPCCDPFSILATRAFLEATFAIPASHRYAESLHYGLLRHLHSGLLRIPFDKPFGWPELPALHLTYRYLLDWQRKARRKLGIFTGPIHSNPQPIRPAWNHAALLEEHLPWLRALCLDQSSSCLWDLVDKSAFERLTADTMPADTQREERSKLYGIATLFLYEQLRKHGEAAGSRFS
jgi:hypothetical protein